MSRTLSNVSSEATEETNTQGELTPILEVSPDDGRVIRIQGRVPQGKAVGVPIYADLRDSNDDPLPLDTEIALAYRAPGARTFEVVTERKDNIRPYRQLAVKEQQNTEHIDAVKFQLKDGAAALDVRDIDDLLVVVEASANIDWGNSRLYFEEKGVAEFSED
jgi:hypothetical protein